MAVFLAGTESDCGSLPVKQEANKGAIDNQRLKLCLCLKSQLNSSYTIYQDQLVKSLNREQFCRLFSIE